MHFSPTWELAKNISRKVQRFANKIRVTFTCHHLANLQNVSFNYLPQLVQGKNGNNWCNDSDSFCFLERKIFYYGVSGMWMFHCSVESIVTSVFTGCWFVEICPCLLVGSARLPLLSVRTVKSNVTLNLLLRIAETIVPSHTKVLFWRLDWKSLLQVQENWNYHFCLLAACKRVKNSVWKWEEFD